MLFAIKRGLDKVDVELFFLGKGIVRLPLVTDLLIQHPAKEIVARKRESAVAACLLNALLQKERRARCFDTDTDLNDIAFALALGNDHAVAAYGDFFLVAQKASKVAFGIKPKLTKEHGDRAAKLKAVSAAVVGDDLFKKRIFGEINGLAVQNIQIFIRHRGDMVLLQRSKKVVRVRYVCQGHTNARKIAVSSHSLPPFCYFPCIIARKTKKVKRATRVRPLLFAF